MPAINSCPATGPMHLATPMDEYARSWMERPAGRPATVRWTRLPLRATRIACKALRCPFVELGGWERPTWAYSVASELTITCSVLITELPERGVLRIPITRVSCGEHSAPHGESARRTGKFRVLMPSIARPRWGRRGVR